MIPSEGKKSSLFQDQLFRSDHQVIVLPIGCKACGHYKINIIKDQRFSECDGWQLITIHHYATGERCRLKDLQSITARSHESPSLAEI